MVKKKKMKLGTKIVIGFGVVAAGLGALLYYLSTRVKGEELVVGKTYYFEYIPGVPATYNIKAFVVPADFPYAYASDIVASIEGGTGTGTGSPCTKIMRVVKWNPVEWNWTAWYYTNQWKGTNFSIGQGDVIGVQIINSFSWTP